MRIIPMVANPKIETSFIPGSFLMKGFGTSTLKAIINWKAKSMIPMIIPAVSAPTLYSQPARHEYLFPEYG